MSSHSLGLTGYADIDELPPSSNEEERVKRRGKVKKKKEIVEKNVPEVKKKEQDGEQPIQVDENPRETDERQRTRGNSGDQPTGGQNGDDNKPKEFDVKLDASELYKSSDEAKKLVVVFTILLTAGQQLSLLSSNQNLGIFTETFGWLSVITLGFDFDEENSDFALAVGVLTMPCLLWCVFSYVRQRPGYDNYTLAADKIERRWYYYLSLVFMVGFSVVSLILSITLDEVERNLTIITFSVVSFCICLIMIPFWYFRVIIYSEILSATSKLTFKTLEVWTIQLFYTTLALPVFSLALRLGEEDRRVIDDDEKDQLPKLGIVLTVWMFITIGSFIVAGSPANQLQGNDFPNLPISLSCCCQSSRSPGFVQYFNNIIYCTYVKCHGPRVGRTPPYPFPYDKKRAWSFPFWNYMILLCIAVVREYVLSRPLAMINIEKAEIELSEEMMMPVNDSIKDELGERMEDAERNFVASIFGLYIFAFLLSCIWRPFDNKKRFFLWIATLSQRFSSILVTMFILIALTKYEDGDQGRDDYFLVAALTVVAFIALFLTTGGIVRLILNNVVVYYFNGDTKRNKKIADDDNSLEQVRALLNSAEQYVDYRMWRYLTQNQRLYLLAKLDTKHNAFDAQPQKRWFLSCVSDNCFLYESDVYHPTWANWYGFWATFLGVIRLSTFDREFIDFKANGYAKVQLLLYRGLNVFAKHQRLKKIEFDGATFTPVTWKFVTHRFSGLESLNLQQIMMENCTFEGNSFLEFSVFLSGLQGMLKALVLKNCTISFDDFNEHFIPAVTSSNMNALFLEDLKDIDGTDAVLQLELIAGSEQLTTLSTLSVKGSPFDRKVMCAAISARLSSDQLQTEQQLKVNLGKVDWCNEAIQMMIDVRKNVAGYKIVALETEIDENTLTFPEGATDHDVKKKAVSIAWNCLKADIQIEFQKQIAVLEEQIEENSYCTSCWNRCCPIDTRKNTNTRCRSFWKEISTFCCNQTLLKVDSVFRFHFNAAEFDEELAVLPDYFSYNTCGCNNYNLTSRGRRALKDNTHPFFFVNSEIKLDGSNKRLEFLYDRMVAANVGNVYEAAFNLLDVVNDEGINDLIERISTKLKLERSYQTGL